MRTTKHGQYYMRHLPDGEIYAFDHHQMTGMPLYYADVTYDALGDWVCDEPLPTDSDDPEVWQIVEIEEETR